jgi:hypothetical protein
MNMRLLGARTMQEVVPEMVDASNIHSHVATVPVDRLYEGNCKFTSDPQLLIDQPELDQVLRFAQLRTKL